VANRPFFHLAAIGVVPPNALERTLVADVLDLRSSPNRDRRALAFESVPIASIGRPGCFSFP
jgi:hypothetical protein